MTRHPISSLLWLALLALAIPARADEGMWLFNSPPRELLKKNHNFDLTDAWLDHVMHSAVRFNSGGSGSFVSADGLVMTNHHVGAGAIQKLSTRERDLMRDGFYAAARDQELKCVDTEINVLMEILDVTDRVKAAVTDAMSTAQAQVARRAVMNTIEQESLKETGLRSDVVTLYQGGRYHLYRYKKYTDVRLVYAPEKDIAFFGGDPDNFEYPRYDLDITFFRAYEDGKPAKIKHHLAWSKAGVQDGELVFVTGHPGHTSRSRTIADLEFTRDRAFPEGLNHVRRREVLLRSYSERSLENARRAQDELFGLQNSRKARLGMLAGLQDPAIIKALQQKETALRQQAGPAGAAPWEQIQAAIAIEQRIFTTYGLLERGDAFNSKLFRIARELVRLTEETTRPNAERLREYRESNLESLRQQLFSAAPIYPDLETLKLADSLGLWIEKAGVNDPLLQKVLDGQSPQERAGQLIRATKLADVDVRKKLAEGGKAAVAASDDPMIRLALTVDAAARDVRKIDEQQVDEPMRQAYARIAEMRFKALGTSVYPDATFTLRLAFGVVRGYEETDGTKVAPWTTLGDTFHHADEHANVPPFRLPDRWLKARESILASPSAKVPFNFVSTADIIGGNSGSPVINRAGELVGIIFDGNIQSLVFDFAYSEERARAVSVDSRGIVEALRKIYNATALADELTR